MPKPNNKGRNNRPGRDDKRSSAKKENKPFNKFRSSEKDKSGFKKSAGPKPSWRNKEENSPRGIENKSQKEKPFHSREKSVGRETNSLGEKKELDYKKDKFSRSPKPGRDSSLFNDRRGDKKRPTSFKKKEIDPTKEKKKFWENKKNEASPKAGKKPRFSKPRKTESGNEFVKRVKYADFEEGKSFQPGKNQSPEKFRKSGPPAKQTNTDGLIRLNKYLSNAGIASRRDADTLILSGAVMVNGVVVDQLGYKIKPTDKVTYGGESVKGERKVYLLLNKPKDYICTLDDPQERKTVMLLIAGACKERVYPVGRLDRNTTGLLLFTNDGELTTKLTHPKYGVKKIYHVSLNKGLKPEDFKSITEGIELEDGIIKADDLAFVGEGKKEIGIEIHSGRNRIVRRVFEHLGYDVLKLDRVAFAGLTKKDLPRGKHRFLTAKEISFLQMIG